MFGDIGGPELVLILVIGLVLFGPGKLPDSGRFLGEALRGFKKGMDDSDKKPPIEIDKKP